MGKEIGWDGGMQNDMAPTRLKDFHCIELRHPCDSDLCLILPVFVLDFDAHFSVAHNQLSLAVQAMMKNTAGFAQAFT